ncbi:MAG: nitrate reductase molybdenum cofactor assembly chaperone [Bryobacteraceae bacterium]|nr:nitrate reductase molybdenum cofactor assembly chaperone [Bryobacteraceae bacterium]
MGLLLAYPDREYLDRVDNCCEQCRERFPEVCRRLSRLATELRGKPVVELQELYTRTFDLNPVCSLEVGWQLYGEEYARGRFLVAMRDQLRQHGIPESTELPDHLTHLLPLLDRLEPNVAQEFAAEFAGPAVKKMLAAFQGKDNPFRELLLAVESLLLVHAQSELTEVTA